MITLVEYSRRNGLKLNTARKLAERGAYKSAQRIGRDWYIDEAEPYPARKKSGPKSKEKLENE